MTLRVDNLCKRFGAVTAVRDVSATFESARVTALIGPNGAGKTTFFHLLQGFYRADAGRIVNGGRDVTGLALTDRARLGMGMLFQAPRGFDSISVERSVALAMRAASSDSIHCGLSRVVPADRAALDELLGRANLYRVRHLVPSQLSYGTRRCVDLICLVARRCRVLLLDEPFAGLDPASLGVVRGLIRGEAGRGAVLLFSSHEMAAVRELADRVLLFDGGSLADAGSARDVIGGEAFRRAYIG